MNTRRLLGAFAAAFLILFFTQCRQATTAGNISKVKAAILEVDKGITIGDAFDHYKFFANSPSWTEINQNGRRIVQITGIIDFKKLSLEDLENSKDLDFRNWIKSTENVVQKINQYGGVKIMYQFQLNLDDSVEMKQFSIAFINPDNTVDPPQSAWPVSTATFSRPRNDVDEEKEATSVLQAIYKNELPEIVTDCFRIDIH